MRITFGPRILESAMIPVQNQPTSGGVTSEAFSEVTGVSTVSTHFDVNVNVPANCRIYGVLLRVTQALSSPDGGTTFTANFIGGSLMTITSAGAFARNTRIEAFLDPIGSSTSAVANVRVTCNGGKTFNAGGQVTVVVFYKQLTPLAPIP